MDSQSKVVLIPHFPTSYSSLCDELQHSLPHVCCTISRFTGTKAIVNIEIVLQTLGKPVGLSQSTQNLHLNSLPLTKLFVLYHDLCNQFVSVNSCRVAWGCKQDLPPEHGASFKIVQKECPKRSKKNLCQVLTGCHLQSISHISNLNQVVNFSQ